MQDLLRKVEDRGYPADYLLSRIRGMRIHLITDWKSLVFSDSLLDSLPSARYGDIPTDDFPDGVWRHLFQEFGRVYLWMNRTLREIFRPFFLYAELRTISVCLRYSTGGESKKIERLLSPSLLSDEIKEILSGGGNLLSLVGEIEDRFVSESYSFSGLGKAFGEAGLRGAEQFLTTRYLEHTVYSKCHPVMKDFFVLIIDSRNILSLHKYITLDAKETPRFISGGRMSERSFAKIADLKDISGVSLQVRKFAGLWVDRPDAANIENTLYRMVTGFLRRAGRYPLGVGLILDYLWRCSLEARNLSILFQGRDIDREALTGELVR